MDKNEFEALLLGLVLVGTEHRTYVLDRGDALYELSKRIRKLPSTWDWLA